MKRSYAILLPVLFLLTAFPLLAQDAGERPAPNILQITIEDVKPGHRAAHEATEMGWPKAFRASSAAMPYLAMTTVTGRLEAWYITGYASWEAWEKQRAAEDADATLSAELNRLSAADAEHISGMRNIVARFRADLSHRPPLNIGKYRYLNIVTVRVRMGEVDKFVEARKMIKAAHEKAGLTDYYSVFQVVSGMRAPTFLIAIPMKSMAEEDAAPGLHTSDAYRAAMGGDLARAKLAELIGAAILDNESTVFAFSPKMSLPAPEYVAADPDFWAPKAAAAPAPAKGKKTAAKKD